MTYCLFYLRSKRERALKAELPALTERHNKRTADCLIRGRDSPKKLSSDHCPLIMDKTISTETSQPAAAMSTVILL
jgi:hypothetical protein